jgi:hypothetical protein
MVEVDVGDERKSYALADFRQGRGSRQIRDGQSHHLATRAFESPYLAHRCPDVVGACLGHGLD